MIGNKLKKLQLLLRKLRRIGVVLLLIYVHQGLAQVTPKVTSSPDKTEIKIGEQINFQITVEADSSAQIVFPEGQTFFPLEMVEAITSDSTKKGNKIRLQKTYALTQFDSGVYVLPRQKVTINDILFLTDSLNVGVATVPVDTIAQQMYDIKPMLNVDKSYAGLWQKVGWIFLGLLLVGALLYWFVFRKKPLTEEEKEALLPPYDRALLELKRLENSRYLIQDEYKQYYSELTAIVRSYLEEDVHVSALESTTDQLIDKLEMMKDAGELKLDSETIHQFKKVLQTSDLVKFARSKPEIGVAEEDRKAIEQIVIKTKEALPEPTEEELMQTEEYLEEFSRKKQKKKILVTAIIAFAVLLISGISAGAYYGFGYVKDTLTGHPTKELLEGEWITSAYGFPPIQIETPQVLLRQEVKLQPELKATIKELQAFMYRSSVGLFTIGTTSATFTQQVEPDFEQSIDLIIKNFEAQGAKNIITKQDGFTTMAGVKGIKIYGSGQFILPESKNLVKGQYVVLLFGGNGFQQQVIVSWLDGDAYAEEIVNRILRSVDVKTSV